ncbi:N4-gp56 family major capsid protein [Falsiroseomonas tokyonensis]|uniref:N4-gp56 family major capsid protein n=1 Tax=Falsiroseomonas tokyonensis TaxID=430521 RepID=A0ABV7BYW8_9PROT|nr:N4-gp56 family major capsid protein [Falsiroseomonas tokyonensis]MBU8540185.1 N4-gp56 family major capsid protein [Falsiroseomonas tokyonensis]
MAATDFGALSTAKKRVWSSEIWMAGREQNFWFSNGFIGDGTGSVIQRITQLTETEKGRTCVMSLVGDMEGDGVVGDNLLEGNEESLWNDTLTITIDQLRNGTRSKGKMAEQETVIRFRTQSKEKLSFWLADKIDELAFLTISGIPYTKKLDGSTRNASSQLPGLAFAADVVAPSSGRVRYAGTATSTASLTASDKINWNLIVTTAAFAKRKLVKPIRSGGRDYYAMVLSTEQMRDLKTDNTYQTLVSKAAPRGTDNPLFKGATAVVEGVVLYDHQKVANTLGLTSGVDKWGAGSTIDGAQALLLGAQALGFAQLGNVDYAESDNTDYKNRPGIGIGRIIGMLKPNWKSLIDNRTRQDFGVVSLFTAASAA